MKAKKLQQKKHNYLAWSFGIPFGGMLLIMLFGGFAPFGNSSILYSDCYHQYFPFFKAFCQAMKNGESLLYSFNVGMGMDYLGLISYYLASPFYLLGILIPDSLLLGYFSILLPIRLGLAGLFFALFLKKVFQKDDISIAIFGSFYALCAWSMGFFWNVMWLDTFALLPLVALGMYSLLAQRKFILYTIALFFSISANYYIGFFVCIFVLLSFICYEICRWQGVKKFTFDLLWIALFSIIAIGMTAALELSAFAALQTTNASDNTFPTKFMLNIAEYKLYQNVNSDWQMAVTAWKSGNTQEAISLAWGAFSSATGAIFDAMRQCAGNMYGGITPSFKEGLPNLYCGVGTIIFAFIFLTCKQVKLRDKICTVGLLIFFILSFIIRQLDYIWHGFHFTNMIPYRFSFLFSFVMLYMAYRAYLLKDEIKLWQVIVAGVLAIAMSLFSNELSSFIETVSADTFGDKFVQLISNWSFTKKYLTELLEFIGIFSYPVYNLLFLIGYFIVLVYLYLPKKAPNNDSWLEQQNFDLSQAKRKRIGSTVLLCVMCFEIGMNLINFATNFGGTRITSYPRGKEDSEKIFQVMHARESDSLFYRAEVTHSQTLNDAALNGYNGISTFTSSANVRVTEFMKHLGYGAKNTYNRYCFEESSPVANLFLNLKYMVERSGNTAENIYFDVVASSGDVYLLENNAYLPLGFMVNEDLGMVDFSKSNDDFEFQNLLLTAASGVYADAWRFLNLNDLSISSDDVTINSQTNDGYCSYSAATDGTIVYTYTPSYAGLMCIDLTQSKRNGFVVYFNGEKLYSETYSLPQMLSVCNVTPGDTVEVKFSCKAGESGTIDMTAAILDEDVFRQAHAVLNKSTLELTSFSNTKIEGTIQCDRNGLLYTSIPQNADNWSVLVDGKESEIVLIGDCMIAVPLNQGNHAITFIYHNKAFYTGLIISSICTLILVVLWIIVYKPDFKKLMIKNSKGKYQK